MLKGTTIFAMSIAWKIIYQVFSMFQALIISLLERILQFYAMAIVPLKRIKMEIT